MKYPILNIGRVCRFALRRVTIVASMGVASDPEHGIRLVELLLTATLTWTYLRRSLRRLRDTVASHVASHVAAP
jgi:hypothetical protein